jgi:hypothetical protein
MNAIRKQKLYNNESKWITESLALEVLSLIDDKEASSFSDSTLVSMITFLLNEIKSNKENSNLKEKFALKFKNDLKDKKVDLFSILVNKIEFAMNRRNYCKNSLEYKEMSTALPPRVTLRTDDRGNILFDSYYDNRVSEYVRGIEKNPLDKNSLIIVTSRDIYNVPVQIIKKLEPPLKFADLTADDQDKLLKQFSIKNPFVKKWIVESASGMKYMYRSVVNFLGWYGVNYLEVRGITINKISNGIYKIEKKDENPDSSLHAYISDNNNCIQLFNSKDVKNILRIYNTLKHSKPVDVKTQSVKRVKCRVYDQYDRSTVVKFLDILLTSSTEMGFFSKSGNRYFFHKNMNRSEVIGVIEEDGGIDVVTTSGIYQMPYYLIGKPISPSILLNKRSVPKEAVIKDCSVKNPLLANWITASQAFFVPHNLDMFNQYITTLLWHDKNNDLKIRYAGNGVFDMSFGNTHFYALQKKGDPQQVNIYSEWDIIDGLQIARAVNYSRNTDLDITER